MSLGSIFVSCFCLFPVAVVAVVLGKEPASDEAGDEGDYSVEVGIWDPENRDVILRWIEIYKGSLMEHVEQEY